MSCNNFWWTLKDKWTALPWELLGAKEKKGESSKIAQKEQENNNSNKTEQQQY